MNDRSPDSPSRILLYDEDRLFCESLRRAARKSGMTVVSCYNASDFWQTLLVRRHEIAGVVVSHTLVKPLVQAPLAAKLADTPVVVTGAGQRGADLPLQNATFIQKRAGIPAVLNRLLH